MLDVLPESFAPDVMTKPEAYTWQLVWFFSMNVVEQRELITPYIVEGFVRETQANPGANHVYGLSVSLNYIIGADEESEDLLCDLRERLFLLSDKFIKPREWGFEVISKTKEWADIRKIAQEALKKDGYRVTPPRKPMEIGEYPDHFQEIK